NPHVDLGAAANFIWRNARVLERHVFAALFLRGEKMCALEALRPYQNKDGGFGNGLEPDLRGPVSQPVPTEFAFRTLDQVGAFEETMIARACDYLLTVTTSEGGVPWCCLPFATTRGPLGGRPMTGRLPRSTRPPR